MKEIEESLATARAHFRNDGEHDVSDSVRLMHDIRWLLADRAAMAWELERVKLVLGDAAREIPNVAGPVTHRIRMLRESLSSRIAELEAKLADSERITAEQGREIERLRELLSGVIESGGNAMPNDLDEIRAALSPVVLFANGAEPVFDPTKDTMAFVSPDASPRDETTAGEVKP